MFAQQHWGSIAVWVGVMVAVHSLRVSADSPPGEPGVLLNLKFEGGSAEEYIDLIRQSSCRPNIVINDSTLVNAVEVPAVELSSVTPHVALTILEQCNGRDDQGRLISIILRTELGRRPGEGGGWIAGGEPIYQIDAQINDPFSSPSLVLRVLSLERVRAAGLEDDHVLTAVETALSMASSGNVKAQIKFHKETGLLLVRGSPEQVDGVEQVVHRLSGRADDDLVKRLTEENRILAEAVQRGSESVGGQQTRIEKLIRQIEEIERQIAELKIPSAAKVPGNPPE